jgi:hypothetical protein
MSGKFASEQASKESEGQKGKEAKDLGEERRRVTGLDWNGLDWTGLDGTRLDWAGLGWTGLGWAGPDWIELDWTYCSVLWVTYRTRTRFG